MEHFCTSKTGEVQKSAACVQCAMRIRRRSALSATHVIEKVVTVIADMRYAVICPPRSTRRTTEEELGGSLWDFAYFFSYAVLLRH
jgi:hypothetical protein